MTEGAEQAVLENNLTEHGYQDILKNCKEIVKELKVDWDTTIADSFNPLHLALQLNANSNLNTEFRDMSHRLEFFLDKVIALNFRGFSESLNGFFSFRDLNKETLETLDLCEDNAMRVKEWRFDRINVDFEKENIECLRKKYDVCKKIMEGRNSYKMYQNTEDVARKSVLIGQCLEALNDQSLLQIRGVFEYLKILKKSFLETCNEVNQKLFDFIFRNEIDSLVYFKSLMNMGAIAQFDEYCKQHFDRSVFNEIERTIMRRYKTALPSCLSDPLLELESLCSEVCKRVESIVENMETIVKRCSQVFAVSHEEDFFGAKKDKVHFVMAMDPALECIKQNLEKFIECYSKEEMELADKIDVYDGVDDTEYSEVYKDSPICGRLQQTEGVSNFAKKHFTVITVPSDQIVGCVLSNVRNPHLRSFVRQLAEGSYFSSASVEKNMFRVDSAFRGNWMDSDPNTGKTKLLVEARDIIRSCRSIEEERRVKVHFRKKLLGNVIAEYTKVFTSEFVKKPVCVQVEGLQDKSASYDKRRGDSRIRIGILPRNNKISGSRKDGKAGGINNDTDDLSSISGVSDTNGSQSAMQTSNQLHGRSLLPDDCKVSSYVVPYDEFNEMLITNHIDRNDLFDNEQKYLRVVSLIDTLQDLECLINSSEARFICKLYSESLKNQALLDCFYYFDLLYRQGNYSFYMKKMIGILRVVYQISGLKYLERFEETLEYYCVKNVYSIGVKNRKELDKFIANLEILSEVLDELGLSFKLDDLVRFFREGKSIEKFGEKYTNILNQKIA